MGGGGGVAMCPGRRRRRAQQNRGCGRWRGCDALASRRDGALQGTSSPRTDRVGGRSVQDLARSAHVLCGFFFSLPFSSVVAKERGQSRPRARGLWAPSHRRDCICQDFDRLAAEPRFCQEKRGKMWEGDGAAAESAARFKTAGEQISESAPSLPSAARANLARGAAGGKSTRP